MVEKLSSKSKAYAREHCTCGQAEDCIRVAEAYEAGRAAALEEAAELCLKGEQFLKACCKYECSENARVIRALEGR